MKYNFNKLFLLLIKKKKKSWKTSLRLDLGLLGSHLGNNLVSALLDVRHCHKFQSCAIPRKMNDANLRKWHKNLNFFFSSVLPLPVVGQYSKLLSYTILRKAMEPNLSFHGFYLYQMLGIVASYHCMQFQKKRMVQTQ